VRKRSTKLPGHALSIRKDQCAAGTPQANALVDPVTSWERAVGAKKATIDLGPRDVDRDGRVWLLLEVRSVGAGASTGGAPITWQIRDIGMSIDAQVIAPARATAMDATTQHSEVDKQK